MTDAPATQPTVQGSLPLYKKPVPLNVEAHKGKGVKFSKRPFEFLATTHFVPVTLGEFAPSSWRYPVIFLGDNKTPVAAMGLRQGENLFVDAKTFEFERFAYLPAFVRRYPFVAASHDQDKERFTVCVDEGSELFSDKPDEPFFNKDGKPSDFTNRAIDFVRSFEGDVRNTEAFVKKMNELELFDQQQATFQPRDNQGQPQGDPQVVASYWAVSGEKLKALPADKLAELRDNTYLAAIYAHMMSMAHWETLINRTAARNGGGQPAAQPAPPPAPEA